MADLLETCLAQLAVEVAPLVITAREAHGLPALNSEERALLAPLLAAKLHDLLTPAAFAAWRESA